MGIEQLKGFQLEGVRFSISSYALDFQGFQNQVPKTYHVGTNYYLSPSKTKLIDASERISETLWPILGETLIDTAINENEKFTYIEFLFENNESFVVWQESTAEDNLLIVRNPHSDEWFTVL